jgi:hypothetical protein
MAVNWTVGSGGTYATWAAAIQALPATLADDYDLVQVGDTNETVSYGNKPVNLNGYNLTMRSASPHGGDPTQGHKITSTTDAVDAIRLSISNTGGAASIECKDLNVQWDSQGYSAILLLGQTSSSMAFLIHDLILTNVDAAGWDNGLRLDVNAFMTASVWNVEAYGWNDGLYFNPGAGNLTVENCTSMNASSDSFYIGGSSATATMRNCVGEHFNGAANADGYNNASVDTSAADGNWSTGSGNVTGITLSNEFVSLDPTNTDFAKVQSGGSCDDGGMTTTISANTVGIRGNARPGTDSQYSIGADELISISSPTVTSCNPNDGAAAGGTPVTVGGTDFAAGATVTFDGASATSVVVVGPTSITCVTPAGNGVVDVKVTNTDTGNGTLSGGFSYIGVSEEGAETPVTVPTQLGEGGAGIFRSSPGLGDVLNKIAVCLRFIKLATQQDNFAEFKTAMEDLVAPSYSPRPRYITPYPAPDPAPITVPRRTGEGRVGLNRAQTSEMGVGLKDVIDRIALMIQEIQEASQLADFAAFKAAMVDVPVLNKSADSRV